LPETNIALDAQETAHSAGGVTVIDVHPVLLQSVQFFQA
jgi:hypothetical protein